jgi:hypothetical protein
MGPGNDEMLPRRGDPTENPLASFSRPKKPMEISKISSLSVAAELSRLFPA